MSANGWTVPSTTTLHVDVLRQLLEADTAKTTVPKSPRVASAPRLHSTVAGFASTVASIEERQSPTTSSLKSGHLHSFNFDTVTSANDGPGSRSVEENRTTVADAISPAGLAPPTTTIPAQTGDERKPAAGAFALVDVGDRGVEVPLKSPLSKKQELKMKRMFRQAARAQAQAEEESRQAQAATAMAKSAAGVEGADVTKVAGAQTMMVPESLPVQNTSPVREAENNLRVPEPSSTVANTSLASESVLSITPTVSRQTTLRSAGGPNTPLQAPSMFDLLADESVTALLVSEEQVKLQLSAAVSDFLNSGGLGAGERALHDLPTEHRWRFINKVVLAATLCKGLSNARLVSDLISSVASNELCSSDCIVLGFSRVMEVLDVVAQHTPDASSRVAIMLKGAHLNNVQLVGLVEQAAGYEREMLVGLLL